MATPVGQRPAKVPSVLRCAYSRVVSLEAAIRGYSAYPPASSLPSFAERTTPLSTPTRCSAGRSSRSPSRAPPLPPDVTFQLLGDPDDVISARSRCSSAGRTSRTTCCATARADAARTPTADPPRGGANFATTRRIPPRRDPRTSTSCTNPPRSTPFDARHGAFASRVGDAVFLHLLTRASVFTPLGERGSSGDVAAGSHLQLCGAPVASAARGRAGAAARARAATTQDARARDLNPRGGKMATKAARGGREEATTARFAAVAGGGGRGGGGDGSPGGRDGFGRSAAASSEEPRGRVASAPAFVEDANVSPVELLRRASVFVRGVMTANPFMRRALARRKPGRRTTPRDRDGTAPRTARWGRARKIPSRSSRSHRTRASPVRADPRRRRRRWRRRRVPKRLDRAVGVDERTPRRARRRRRHRSER